MNWNSAQFERYRRLTDACSSQPFSAVAALCFDDCRLSLPVSVGTVITAETTLGCVLPAELKELYSQTDGMRAHYGTDLVLPLREAVRQNETFRLSAEFRSLYMPFDHLLFFGSGGNGDLFFFPILTDGSVKPAVFVWDHESDGRCFFANNLKDFLVRYTTNLEA